MIAVASVLGLLMALKRRDAGYLFVLVWSFVGIALKQVTAPNVVLAAWIAAGLMFILAIYSLTRRKVTA
jgi:lipopolysaccharide export LptBFGC system permease protein LptF